MAETGKILLEPQLGWKRILVLIKSEDKYYTFKDGEFVEIEPTEENFELHPLNLEEVIAEVDGVKPIMTLKSPEIVVLSKEVPKIEVNGFKDISAGCESDIKSLLISSELEPKVTIDAIPFPQLVIPLGDIEFHYLKKVQKFFIDVKREEDSSVRIILSNDSGATWMTYDNVQSEFIDIDINNISTIKSKGISVEMFNNIPQYKWTDIVENKIRFAYYLELGANVDQLDAEIKVFASWADAIHEEDYDYYYKNESIKMILYKNGGYKINYME